MIRKSFLALGAAGLVMAHAALAPALAQVVVRGQEGRPGHELRPAPGSLRADVPLIVAQPSPSDVDPHLLGPVLWNKSARVDLERGTATLPLRRGRMASGETVWFIITDTDNRGIADLMGVVHAPKLGFTEFGRAVRSARIEPDGTFTFQRGRVDFSPDWSVTPGDAPNFFPPKAAQPGSVGDRDYTPLVRTSNAGGHLYNAPVVAFNVSEERLNRFCGGDPDYNLVHDHVTAICPRDGTVTMSMTLAFSFSKPIFYLSTESNDPVIATLEKATHTPALADIAARLEDAAPGSGAERIVAFANGPMGRDNPQRQGVNSALGEGLNALNVAGGVPFTNLDYSPIWDLMPVRWTDAAIQRGFRARMTDVTHIHSLEAQGWLTGLEGGPIESSGIMINCPVIYRVN